MGQWERALSYWRIIRQQDLSVWAGQKRVRTRRGFPLCATLVYECEIIIYSAFLHHNIVYECETIIYSRFYIHTELRVRMHMHTETAAAYTEGGAEGMVEE